MDWLHLGFVLGFGLEALGVEETLRRHVNDGLDAWAEVAHNVAIITRVTAQRAVETVRSTATRIAERVSQATGRVVTAVQNAGRSLARAIDAAGEATGKTVDNVMNAASSFFGSLFGGG